MIVIDTNDGEPTNPVRAPGGKKAAHVLSDRPGEPGTKELLDFGRRIGLKRSWLQAEGSPKEHFDVWGTKLKAALNAGAEEVGMQGMVDVIQKKREAYAEG